MSHLKSCIPKQIRFETHELHIPENADALSRQCGEYFREGDYQKGIVHAMGAVDFDNNATAQRQAGLGFAYLGHYPLARRYFQQGSLLTSNPHIWANCASNEGTTFLE